VKGKVVRFFANVPQRKLLSLIFDKKAKRIVVPKARKLGMSTLTCLYMLDRMMTNANIEARIVDARQTDAQSKLVDIVQGSYEQLEPEFKRANGVVSASSTEMAWVNGSLIRASVSSRGGTPQCVLISEFGIVAHRAPLKAEEIKTGTLGSVPANGLVVVESTAMGRHNLFHDLVNQANSVSDSRKTALDWHCCFCAWWEDMANSLDGDFTRVTEETHAYLNKIGKRFGRVILPGQRLWYQVKAVEEQGIFRKREFPSTLEECFEAPIEGAIYGLLVAALRDAGGVYDFEWDRAFPVFCAFDIGFSDSTAVWFFQIRGNCFDFVHYVERRHHSAAAMMNVIRETGIPVAAYLLPHDCLSKNAATGTDYITALRDAGAKDVRVVLRTLDAWLGINAARDAIPRCRFSEAHCKEGLLALESYHTAAASDDGRETTEPVHDWSSHGADAFRYVFEALGQGLISADSFKQGEAMRDYQSQFPDRRDKVDNYDPWGGYSL
jgi:hypothetical protein